MSIGWSCCSESTGIACAGWEACILGGCCLIGVECSGDGTPIGPGDLSDDNSLAHGDGDVDAEKEEEDGSGMGSGSGSESVDSGGEDLLLPGTAASEKAPDVRKFLVGLALRALMVVWHFGVGPP